MNFTGDDSFDYKLEYDFFSNILTKPMIQYQVILYKILLLHFLFGRGFFYTLPVAYIQLSIRNVKLTLSETSLTMLNFDIYNLISERLNCYKGINFSITARKQ